MSSELEFRTLDGSVITLEVMLETTIGELKTMLLEKRPRAEDLTERKLLRVELLLNSSIMEMEDAQTLGATGLLEAEAPTVIYHPQLVLQPRQEYSLKLHRHFQLCLRCLRQPNFSHYR